MPYLYDANQEMQQTTHPVPVENPSPMLSAEEIDIYHRDGYVTPSLTLGHEDVASIKESHDRLLDKHPEFVNYCPSLLRYDTWFLNIARMPAILDMVEQLIGPDFALWNASFFAKPANGGHATPWHQDGEYWPIVPLATCTVWIAVDSATPANGCLQVIPGSHQDQRLRRHHTNTNSELTLNQELDADELDLSASADIVLESGQVSLHDVYLLHGSQANHSPDSRRGMTLRFMPTTSVYDRDLARHKSAEKGLVDQSERTLYLMRGQDKSGLNDFRVRL